MIYLISDGKFIKIGKSVNPNRRLKQLQTGSNEKLSLLAIYDRPDYMEKRLHHLLRGFKSRLKSEWFYFPDQKQMLNLIDRIVK